MAHLELICASHDLDDKRKIRGARGRGDKAAIKRHLRPLACHCHCHEKIDGADAQPCEHAHAHPDEPWHSDTEADADEPAARSSQEADAHEQPADDRPAFEPLPGLSETEHTGDGVPFPSSVSIGPLIAGEDKPNSRALTSQFVDDNNSRLSERSAPSLIGGDELHQTSHSISAPAAFALRRTVCRGALSSRSHDSFRLPEHSSGTVIPDSDPEDESETSPAAFAASRTASPATKAKHFVAPDFPVLSSVSTCCSPTASRLLSSASASCSERAVRALPADRDETHSHSFIPQRRTSGSSSVTAGSPSAARSSVCRTPEKGGAGESQQPSSFASASSNFSQRSPSVASTTRSSPVFSQRKRNATGRHRRPLPLMQGPSGTGSCTGRSQSTQSSQQSQSAWLHKQATLPAWLSHVEPPRGLLAAAPPQAAAAAAVSSASAAVCPPLPPAPKASSRSRPLSRPRVPLETIVLDDDDDDDF